MKLIKFYLLFTLAILLGCSTSSDNSTNPQPPFGPDYILLSSDQTIVEVGETVTMNVVDIRRVLDREWKSNTTNLNAQYHDIYVLDDLLQ